MSDEARKWTDDKLTEIEDRLRQIYTDADAELSKKWSDYLKRGQKRLSALFSKWQNEPDNAALKKAYQDALQSFTLNDKRFREMAENIAIRLANINELAAAYINGNLTEIYRINYNHMEPGMKGLGISFTLIDESTVARLVEQGEIQLPYKELDPAKDIPWNLRQLNSSLLQGILQGESIPKLSERIKPIVHNNEVAAMRTARTMVTGAENAGRLNRYTDLEREGAVIQKTWIATHDARVRDWHISMDGQTVDTDSPFTDGNGDKLMYPGDPTAPGRTVYNCRCSMKSKIIGVRGKDGRIHYV